MSLLALAGGHIFINMFYFSHSLASSVGCMLIKLFSFIYWSKYHHQEQLGVGKSLFQLVLLGHSLSLREVRTETQDGIWNIKNIGPLLADWSETHCLISILIQLRTMVGTPIMRWVHVHQLIIKIMPFWYAHRPMLSRQFLHQDFLSDDQVCVSSWQIKPT